MNNILFLVSFLQSLSKHYHFPTCIPNVCSNEDLDIASKLQLAKSSAETGVNLNLGCVEKTPSIVFFPKGCQVNKSKEFSRRNIYFFHSSSLVGETLRPRLDQEILTYEFDKDFIVLSEVYYVKGKATNEGMYFIIVIYLNVTQYLNILYQ